ncbi:MAG: hypothetical protein CFH34_01594, partial [Alphaproteobacteria bacterium MarineAlpha9_Bin4]
MLSTFSSLEKELSDLKEFQKDFKNDQDQNLQMEILDLAKTLKKNARNIKM